MEKPEEKIRETAERIAEIPQLAPENVPEIDLYMDQLLSFLDTRLGETGMDGRPFLTKTMVNNYVKAKLLPPVVKKKYRRRQVLSLALIGELKHLLSMQELQKFYAAAEQDDDWERLYRSFLDSQKEAFAALPELAEQLEAQSRPEENREYQLAEAAVRLAAQAQARMMLAVYLLKEIPGLREKQKLTGETK